MVKECEDYKKFPRDIFIECGIDPDIVGDDRIHSSAKRWRKQYKKIGKLKDNRKGSSGRPLERELDLCQVFGHKSKEFKGEEMEELRRQYREIGEKYPNTPKVYENNRPVELSKEEMD